MSFLPDYSRSGKAYKVIFFIASLVEILLFSGITYGWAAIVVVFKKEGFFENLCDTRSTSDNLTLFPNGSSISALKHIKNACPGQDERFNLIFTISVFSLCGVTFPIGILVDRFGPRTSRLIGGLLYCVACLGLAFSSKDVASLLFPVFILFSVAGGFIALAIYQMSNLIFTNIKSFIICFLHGAFDSSAVILVIMKLAYDNGSSLKTIGLTYLFITFFLVTLVTIFLVPSYSSLLNKAPVTDVHIKHSTLSLNYIGAKLAQNRMSMLITQNDVSNGNQVDVTARRSLILHDDHESNGMMNETVTFSKDKKNMLQTTQPDEPIETFWSIVRSPMYLLELLFLTIIQLRLWYFIGSLNSYLVLSADGDSGVVDKYSDIFGYVQLCGIVVAPLIGFAFDTNMIRKQSNKVLKSAFEERIDRISSAILPYLITNILCICFSVMTLIRTIEIMIPCFVLKVVVRGFLYGAHGAFIGIAFPPQYYGRLYGFGMFVAGLLGLSQYALFVITTKSLDEDPFWINVILLGTVVFANIMPIYLWFYCRRERKKIPT